MEDAHARTTDASRVRNDLYADLFCDAVSNGQTVAQVCRDLDIPRHQIYAWIEADKAFAERMDAARAAGADAIADEALAIADETAFDTIDGKFGPKLNTEWVARSKLRVETRLKLLAKWHPKRYGDKLEVTANTRNLNVPMSDDPNEAARAYAELVKGVG